jgi:hypothetical protein
VRAVGGGEITLPGIEQLRGLDPVSEKVIEQILLGVSTRSYGRSLERLPESCQLDRTAMLKGPTGCLTGGASAASEEPKAMSESAARAC